jgi:hypothetical protein
VAEKGLRVKMHSHDRLRLGLRFMETDGMEGECMCAVGVVVIIYA